MVKMEKKNNTRQRRLCRVPKKQHSANHLTLGKEPISGSVFDPGELPRWFKNLTHLVSLNAESCNLVGAFPSFLTKMMQLEELYLGNNSLTGTIPPGIWGLKNLQILCVQSNNLRACLEHGFFKGKVKEIKMEERKMVTAFGTKERSKSFPLEYCSNNMISRGKNICSCLCFFDPSRKPDAAARLSSAGWRRFLCYKFLCSKQPTFYIPVF